MSPPGLAIENTPWVPTKTVLQTLSNGYVAPYAISTFEGMVGESAPMRELYERIERFASQPADVLITGETGVGKELVSRALHVRSERAKGPFVALACGAVPLTLAESELFGHEAGAFSGARRTRKGRMERADSGTLLLDDIDDLPRALQSKLLRVLQERTFERVGGEDTHRADIRVIATTKRNLAHLVREGTFREDLYYRLRVLTIDVPPLRERREDIPGLARHFLAELGPAFGKPKRSLATETKARLMEHHWPGNVRELRHAIEHLLAVSQDAILRARDLPAFSEPWKNEKSLPPLTDRRTVVDFRRAVEGFERKLVEWALEKANGTQGEAARLLGIPRSTLQNKIRCLNCKIFDSGSARPTVTDGDRIKRDRSV